MSIWDAAGFLFCMKDKSSVKLLYSIILQPLVLFNTIKIVLYQEPQAVLTAIFENMLVCALTLQVVILGFGIDFHKAILNVIIQCQGNRKKLNFLFNFVVCYF